MKAFFSFKNRMKMSIFHVALCHLPDMVIEGPFLCLMVFRNLLQLLLLAGQRTELFIFGTNEKN